IRLDDLLVQRSCVAPPGGAVFAFCTHVSGTPRLCRALSPFGCARIRAGAGLAGCSCFGAQVLAGQRTSAMESGSAALGLLHPVIRGRSRGIGGQLSACCDTHPAPAVEVDYARHGSRDHAIYLALCSAVLVRRDALDGHEGLRPFARTLATDI